MTPTISVIIPVYNAEQYLSKCIESVLAQSGCSAEIVLINDGSKDRSLDICREYASRHECIRLIDQPNGGVSAARNAGIEGATGEWITFLDADDWLTSDAFATLLPHMADNDVVRFGIEAIYADGHTYRYKLPYAPDRNKALSNVLGSVGFNGIGGVMCRRKMFINNNIQFSTELHYTEDWLVLGTLLYYSKKVKILHNAYLYIYNRYNESSATNTMSIDKQMQTFEVIRKFRELVGTSNFNRELNRSLCRRTSAFIKNYGFEVTAREMVAARDKISIPTLRDILTADVHLSLRVRLLRLWFGHLRPMLRKRGE